MDESEKDRGKQLLSLIEQLKKDLLMSKKIVSKKFTSFDFDLFGHRRRREWKDVIEQVQLSPSHERGVVKAEHPVW